MGSTSPCEREPTYAPTEVVYSLAESTFLFIYIKACYIRWICPKDITKSTFILTHHSPLGSLSHIYFTLTWRLLASSVINDSRILDFLPN